MRHVACGVWRRLHLGKPPPARATHSPNITSPTWKRPQASIGGYHHARRHSLHVSCPQVLQPNRERCKGAAPDALHRHASQCSLVEPRHV